MTSYSLGLSPAFARRLMDQLAESPTAGMGYLIQQDDELGALLSQAYGDAGPGLQDPFMQFNGQLQPDQFGDLSGVAGQLLYFPLLQQLLAAQGNAAAPLTGFGAMDAMMAQAGLPPSVAQQFMAAAAAAEFARMAADPALANMVRNMMQGGIPAQPGPMDVNRWNLDEAALMALAEEAIRDGRTTMGGRGTRITPERVHRALEQDWRPRTGESQNGCTVYNQADYNSPLGNGGASIRRAGCFLTSMTMAATKLSNPGLDPLSANRMITQAGGFSGSNLVPGTAAAALGMRLTARSQVHPGNARIMSSRLDQALGQGKPVVAGVNYKAGSSSAVSNADHFLCITARNPDGSYSANDPAGGKVITLQRGADGMLRGGKYTVSELVFLDRR